MIENIRKYTGLMIVVLVLLFVGLTFFGDRATTAGRTINALIKIDGRGYSDREFQKLGHASREIAKGLGMYEYLSTVGALSYNQKEEQESEEKFFINRMIIRRIAEEYGIFPSEEDTSKYIREMRAFQGQDGKFNEDGYRNFISFHIGRLGASEEDVRELARDAIATHKLMEVVGSGLPSDRSFVSINQAVTQQQVSAEIAHLSLDTFEAKQQASDEDVKKYWEGVQDGFTTEPKRKFTYVLVSPKYTEAPKPAEAKPADPAKPADAKPSEDPKVLEDRRKVDLALSGQVEKFIDKLDESKGEGFADVAKGFGWEVKSSDLVSAGTLPDDLKLPVRSSTSAKKTEDLLFDIQVTSDPLSKISGAIPVGDNQWIVARLDKEEASRVKTFDEAKADARKQYISEKAREAMRLAAEDTVKKLKDAVASGKSFVAAAKELGLEVKTVASAGANHKPDGDDEPAGLFRAVAMLDAGSIADPLLEPVKSPTRAFLVHLTKREVYKQENPEAALQAQIKSAESNNAMIAFMAWLGAKTESAKIERLYKR
jgi:peptidyl-prolyl cis-trans isomerase D